MQTQNTQVSNLTTSLSSLAMLSLKMQEGKDYLDYLEGFVLEAIRQIGSDKFDAAKIQICVEKEFGLKIPAATFAIYLKRLTKRKIIQPTPDGREYQVDKLPSLNVHLERQAVGNQIQAVTAKLAIYAKIHYTQEWSDETSAAALTEFLRDYSIVFVRYSEFNSPLPNPGGDNKQAQYIVASFIRHCAESEPSVFESIKTLVQSHILANAFLCPDLRDSAYGFKNVNFLVDTRFLLKALDLESQYDTDNTRQLLTTIRNLKGSLCVFHETKQELRTVLISIIKGFQSGTARGPVPMELHKRSRGVADVIMAESNLENRLKKLFISTLQSPSYDETNYRFQIDENALRDEIEEEIGYVPGKSAEHDIRAVRNIFALRKGRHVSRIEDAGYVFLTTNAALSRAAFNYQRGTSEGWVFSAVVTDYHLSHLAWLKSPVDAGNLSRTEILASCYSAMRPHESFWRRYVEELERLKNEGKVTQRDHEVLRFSLNAPDELMEVTRGEIDGINERTMRIMLEKLEKTYAAEKERALVKEKADHDATRRALEAADEMAKREIEARLEAVKNESALHRDKALVEDRLRIVEQINQQLKERESSRKARVEKLAEQISSVAFLAGGLIFAIIFLLSIFSYISLWFGVPAAIISFASALTGFSGNTIKTRAREWVSQHFGKFVE